MTKILDWQKSDDPRDIVHLAVQALVEGHIVAIPSQSSYLLVASGLCASAIELLAKYAGAAPARRLALLARSPDETLDYFPDVSPSARRLAKKAWPGPLALDLMDSHSASALRCLDTAVTRSLSTPSHRLRICQPAHEVVEYIYRLISGPLVCCTAPVSPSALAARPMQRSAMSASELVPEQSVLAIDDGQVEFPGELTAVEVDGSIGRIVEHGIFSEEMLRSLSQFSILFVCTGNTCRSPMAQVLMNKKIAERFGHLAKDGILPIVAMSAGVSAFGGDPASIGAKQAIRSFSADLESHSSTQLNSELVERADLILAMSGRHKHVIVSQWPSIASNVFMICPDGGEIADPFGGPVEIYQKCAQQLDRHTSYWLDQLDTSALVQWQ